MISRRVMWRIAQGQYDPLALLGAYMIRWKLLMRRITLMNPTGGWDAPVGQEAMDTFIELVADMKQLRHLRFPRCLRPREPEFSKPMLLVFGTDPGTLVAPWPTSDGSEKMDMPHACSSQEKQEWPPGPR